MMVVAGSMPEIVAIFATSASPNVAISSADGFAWPRYSWRMSSQWLRAALTHAKMSQAALARELNAWRDGYGRDTVNKIATGKRRLTSDEMVQVARITGYPLPPVDSGDGEQDGNGIPLIGFVGAGAVLVEFETGGVLEWVPMVEDATEHTKALGIRGQSLGEIFEDWIVYYDEVRDTVTPAMLGRLCVLGLPDGRQMVKKVRAGREPGTFDLYSNVETPIYGVEIEWAALVKTMRQRAS